MDHELCRCREQACFPQCQAMQRCQLLSTQEKPSCVCKRPIPGQDGAYSCPLGYQPDARCKFVYYYYPINHCLYFIIVCFFFLENV